MTNYTETIARRLFQISMHTTNISKVDDLMSLRREANMLAPAMLDAYLRHVLDPSYNYYMTHNNLPEPELTDIDSGCDTDLAGLLDLLELLHRRDLSGSTAEKAVATWLFRADPSSRILFKYAIQRQLPGKIGTTIVNKACPGLIYKQPYPGVNSWDANKVDKLFNYGTVLWQRKMDGMALMIDTDGGSVRTRAGQDVTKQLAPYLGPVYGQFEPGYVLFVEANLWDPKWESIMPRPKSNGVFNAIFKSNRKIAQDRIVLTILDMIPADIFYGGKGGPRAADRWDMANDLVIDYNSARTDDLRWPFIEMVEMHVVKTLEEAQALTRKEIAEGREGAVLKLADAPHKNGKSGMKMKNEFECTLKVVGWVPHSKQGGWVGSLVCESSDGKLKTNVGSGLNEIDGDPLNRTKGFKPFAGMLIEVKAEKISKNNALDLPRIIEIRRDKTVADSYAEVQAAYNDSISINNC